MKNKNKWKKKKKFRFGKKDTEEGEDDDTSRYTQNKQQTSKQKLPHQKIMIINPK